MHFPITMLDHITKQHTSYVSHTLFNVLHTDLCFHVKNITWVGFVYTGWKYVLKPGQQPQVLETGRKGNSCYDAKVHICLKTLARKPLEKSRLIHALHPHQMTSDRVTPTFLQKPEPRQHAGSLPASCLHAGNQRRAARDHGAGTMQILPLQIKHVLLCCFEEEFPLDRFLFKSKYSSKVRY